MTAGIDPGSYAAEHRTILPRVLRICLHRAALTLNMAAAARIISTGRGRQGSPQMSQVLFSSDELPARLGDAARFARWRDFMISVHGSLDMSCLPNQPFSQRLDAAQFGS